MFRSSIVSVLVISYFNPINSNNISIGVRTVTYENGEFVKEVENLNLAHETPSKEQKLETQIKKLINENETMTNNSTQNSNKTENQTQTEQSKGPGLYKQIRELQKELKILKKEQNETDNYIYQFKWKVLIKTVIMDYEEIFDKIELSNSQPSFHLNETAINQTMGCWNYDRLAEKRRQKWKFYLKTPPYCNVSFSRLVKHIEESKFTVEEFSKALSIFYKRVSFAVHLETIKTIKFTTEFLSHYNQVNFIVPLLLADHPETELIKKIFEDMKS